ncbi:MAG TPA: hypothetical protein VFA90_19270 [Terriglobales bacterium]|nr:hypothetical protein [Terriglobales bacterium]
MKKTFANASLLAAACVGLCTALVAQQDAPPSVLMDAKPTPVLSGGVAFVPTWEGGGPTLVSIVSPVVLVPLGNNFVFESRAEFEGDFVRRSGNSGDFTGAIDKELEYAQLDYIGNRYITITAGRFLTPFNIFNERLYPNWIRNTQSDPLIYPIGTGSDNGIMLRGGLEVQKNVTLNYAVYFSALSNTNHLESERHAGMRAGIFFPRERLEIGGSVQHELQDARLNRYGSYLEWQPRRIPFDLRAEGAYSREEGNGLWVEGAYRFRNAGPEMLRRVQLVARTQAFYASTLTALNEDLPASDTKRTEGGINYYLNDGWKALASYGRTFTAHGNSSIWTVGMTYRFVFPLGGMR